MKKEQAAFGARLAAALAGAGIDASPVELEKMLARYDGEPVTPQAISGWLSGKHMPKQANMRALAAIVGLEPHVLQFGAKGKSRISEGRAVWPPVGAQDRLTFDAFRALPAAQRKLVRELILALANTAPQR